MIRTKSTFKAASALRSVTVGLTLLLAAAIGAQAESANTVISTLSGTWRVTVTLADCTTHAPLAPPFRSMLSFAGNGTLTGTTQNPMFAPGQRTSDFGVWRHAKDGTYRAASEAYLLFDAGPLVRGTQRLDQVIHVNGDKFVSGATIAFFNSDQVLVKQGCAVATGERFR